MSVNSASRSPSGRPLEGRENPSASAPAVLINPNGNTAVYIAATGH